MTVKVMKGNYFEASFFVIFSTERGFSHLVRIPENAVPSPSKPLCILMCFILGASAQSQKSLDNNKLSYSVSSDPCTNIVFQ